MKRPGLLFLFVLALLKISAQDPGLFNTNQSLLFLNPSFAGCNEGLRYQFSYINPDAWDRAFANSIDGYIRSIKAGVGISYVQDRQFFGAKDNSVNLTYAQHLSLANGNIKLIPSVQFTYGHETTPPDYLAFGYNPSLHSRNYFDISSGLLLNYKNKLYVGAYLFNINQPDMGIYSPYKLPMRASVNASYNFLFSEKTVLQLSGKIDRQDIKSSDYSGAEFHTIYTNWQFAPNLLFCKHIMIGGGYKGGVEKSPPNLHTNLTTYGFFNAGYRNNFFTLSASSIFYYSNYSSIPFKFYSMEVSATFNLRSKDKRHALTSFESW